MQENTEDTHQQTLEQPPKTPQQGSPPAPLSDWALMAIVASVAFVAHLLKVSGRGDPFNRSTIWRHIARAGFTGISAAGIWSVITEFRELNPATAVGIAAGAALVGVDLLEGYLDRAIEKRLGLDRKQQPETDPVGGDAENGKPSNRME